MKNIFNNINTKESIARLLVVLLSISFYMLLNNIPAVTKFINNILYVLSPIIWGAIIAYILHPLIKVLEKYLFGKLSNRKIAHNISVFLALIAAIIVLALLIVSIIPQLVSSFFMLINNMEGYFESFKTTLTAWEGKYDFLEIDAEALIGSWAEVFNNITSWIIKNIDEILGASYRVGNGLFSFFLSIILSIYMLLDLDKLKSTFKRLFISVFKEKYYIHIREIARRSNFMFLRFINGNIIDSLIVGCANFIFMTILGLLICIPLFAVIAGLAEEVISSSLQKKGRDNDGNKLL